MPSSNYGFTPEILKAFFNNGEGYFGSNSQEEIDWITSQMNDPNAWWRKDAYKTDIYGESKVHNQWGDKALEAYEKRLSQIKEYQGQQGQYDALGAEAKKIYDPQNVNQIYNAMIGAIGRLGGSAAASARRNAAAQAGASGLANPGAYTSAVASRALQPFNQASTQAETGRAQDLYGAQQKLLGYNTDIAKWRKGNDFEQQRIDIAREGMSNQQSQYDEYMKQMGPNWSTYLTAILGMFGSQGLNLFGKK